jgi:hypothetical protein
MHWWCFFRIHTISSIPSVHWWCFFVYALMMMPLSTHCVFVFTDDALWQLQDFDAQSLISTLRPLERTSPRLLCRRSSTKKASFMPIQNHDQVPGIYVHSICPVVSCWCAQFANRVFGIEKQLELWDTCDRVTWWWTVCEIQLEMRYNLWNVCDEQCVY